MQKEISKHFAISLVGLAIVLILGVTLLVFFRLLLTRQPSEKWGEEIQGTIKVIGGNGTLKEVWSLSSIYIPYSRCCSIFVATGGKVFFIGGLDQPSSETVIALDSGDGSFIWRSENPDGSSFQDLDVTPTALYSGSSGNATLRAYDLNTGQTLWSKRVSTRSRIIDHIRVVENLIYVASDGGPQFVQADNGKILKTFTGPITEDIQKEVAVQLGKTTTWINTEYFEDAAFTEDTKFVKSSGNVRAIDQQTGSELWQIDDIISNIATSEAMIFLITSNRELLGLDPRSGKVIASVRFSPASNETIPTPHPGIVNSYQVAVDVETDLVYAYFGNTTQLFAFRIVDAISENY